MAVPPVRDAELAPGVRQVVTETVNEAERIEAPVEVHAAPGPARVGDVFGGVTKQDRAAAIARVDGAFDAGDNTGNAGIDATLDRFAAANAGNVGATTALEIAAAQIKAAPEKYINPDGSVKKGVLAELLTAEFAAAGPIALPDLSPEGAGALTPGRAYPSLGAMGDVDLTAMGFLVMMEAAKSARDDLAAIMAGVQTPSEAEALRLQQAMDRLSTLMATLTSLLEKASATAASLTADLR